MECNHGPEISRLKKEMEVQKPLSWNGDLLLTFILPTPRPSPETKEPHFGAEARPGRRASGWQCGRILLVRGE